MEKKRERSSNFTNDEKLKLMSLIKENDAILSKRTDGASNKIKEAAWVRVATEFNETNFNKRNVESLKKVFHKLKASAKVYRSKQRFATTATGGGKNKVEYDCILEEVLEMIGREGTGIIGVHDSDEAFNVLQDEECNEYINEEDIAVEIIETEADRAQSTERGSPLISANSARWRPYLLKGDELLRAQIATEEMRRQLLENKSRRAEELHLLNIKRAELDIEIKKKILLKLQNNEEPNPEVLENLK